MEDEIIRRFMRGIWTEARLIFATEMIIKRRLNQIIIAGFVERAIAPKKMYWLIGFSEELLSLILKCPVKLEIQSVESKEDVVYQYV